MRFRPRKLLISLVAGLLFSIISLSSAFPSRTQAAQERARQTTPAEPDDPDLPPFAAGSIDKGEYLRLRAEQVALLRGLEPGTRPDTLARINAIRQMERQTERFLPAINPTSWTPIGPAPLPNGQTTTISTPVSGRATAIAVHPTNPNIAYVGTAQGGLYRTLDGGASWLALMDAADTLAIGAVTIDPLNPSIVFVGTGESNRSLDSYFGVGLYRITSADTSPVLEGPFQTRVAGTGTTASNGNAFLGTSISSIVVDPANDNRIFIGNTVGGGGVSGDGICCGGSNPPSGFIGLYFCGNALAANPVFSRVSGVPGGGVAAVSDIVFEPASSNNMVIGVQDFGGGGNSGIYRTTNAATASQAPSTSPTFTRTLTTGVEDIRLAINRIASTVTVLAARETLNGRLVRSTDGGVTWPTTLTAANGFCGGQCFYDIAVAMEPANANIIYLGGSANSGAARVLVKSTNGGTSFSMSDTGLHADTHAIVLAPSNSAVVYVGNDGGVWRSTDSGTNWTSLNNAGFSATQFESIAVHPLDQFFTIGGTQDNGTPWLRPDNTWTRADFGDGGFARIDQNAPAASTNVTMYHTYFNQTSNLIGFARVTDTTDASDGNWTFLGCGSGATPNGITCTDSVLFYAPLELGPGNPNTLYFGTDRLYRSANIGTTMTVVSQAPIVAGVPISAIGVSPQNDSVRIVGLRNGRVFATTTGSSTLTEITGPIPARYVARAVIDPNDANTAYVTLSGFGLAAGQHVWRTTNLNNPAPTWTAAGTGMPDVPVNAFVVDPANSTNLYAGTDIGVFRSTDSGANWTSFSTGLPRVAVFDMAIQSLHRFLRIATHGRGMWEIALAGAPTAAKMESVNAAGYDDGRVLLEWRTGVEVDNLGFNVYRERAGRRVRITPQLIAGSALLAGPENRLLSGHAYKWADAPPSREKLSYWIEAVDLNGDSTWTGPIEVERARQRRRPRGSSASALLGSLGNHESLLINGLGSAPVEQFAAPPTYDPAAAELQGSLASQHAVKLSVKQEGWYRVTQPELAAAGLNPGVDPRLLQLYVNGVEVPITVKGESDGRLDPADTVEFYGVGVDTPYTSARVYWLVAGSQQGQRFKPRPGKGTPASPGSFNYAVERNDRTVYFSALRNGETENFFGAVLSKVPVDLVLNLQHLAAGAGGATVEAAVQGVTRVDHKVEVFVNGSRLGLIGFSGQERAVSRFSVASTILREGDNVVRLVTRGEGSDVSIVDFIRIIYPHTFVADGDLLRLPALSGQQVTIDGFSNRAIRVLDVTSPNAAVELGGVIRPGKSGFSVTVTISGDGQRRLFAFAQGQAKSPSSLARNLPSSWRTPGRSGGLLIITAGEFASALDPLAALRRSQGLAVATIDIEDIYDEFSFGQKSPQAVKDFILFCRNYWAPAPRFVLLAGDATYDPKNYLGFGDYDRVSTRLIDTQFMETGSDDWFADSNEDGLPELPVGRLPVRTPEECAAVVGKLIGYETTAAVSNSVLLFSDSPDGYPFEAASASLKAVIPSGVRIDEIRRAGSDSATTKASLIDALNRGEKIVNYFGHGSVDLWRGSLTSLDAMNLSNGQKLPLVVSMTCLNGYFQDVVLEGLGEALLKSRRGGAVAVWASSGMTGPAAQAPMNRQILSLILQRSTGEPSLTLGEYTAMAKGSVNDLDVRRTWTLIGDPSMRLR